jgi:hypothetical protein
MTAPFRSLGRSAACAAVLVVAAALAGAPAAVASTPVSATDASATHSYLRIVYAQTHTEAANLRAGIVAIEAFATRLQAQCPGVLANAPKIAAGQKPSDSAVKIAEEELAATFGVAERVEYKRRRAFATAVAPLRWSSRSLTRLVRSYALGELAQAKLPAPNLCADAGAWVSSGYQSVSPGTESYLRRVAALSQATSGSKEVIMRKLAPYESADDKRVAKRIAKFEESVGHKALPAIFAALGKVGHALDTAAAVPAS